ncbi:ribonucleotide reductase, barrel domain protein, partial [Vibrio parahaemolyticus V-223/04]
MSFVPRNKL